MPARKITKESTKKSAAKTTKPAADGVTLADLAKELKVKPASLRRTIRNMDGLGEQEQHRYFWPKSSPDLKKIRAHYAE